MSQRILFVDDDHSLLNSIERNLCLDYDMATAASGPEGLAAIADGKAFSVVFSDMLMPGMDGVQFIEARKIAPDSVYLMLTGNQDLTTAMKAVNEGHVFRFLNKPCQMAEITAAIAAAQRQYDLVRTEKELLHRTFVGAIGVLSDVVESLQPNVAQQSGRVTTIMKSLESALELPERWEHRLASRLAFLGVALLPESQQSRFCTASAATTENVSLLNAIAGVSSRMIERIPRLETVAAIIERQSQVDGSLATGGSGDEALIAQGATLVRIATLWSAMTASGLAHDAAIAELKTAFPRLDRNLAKALAELDEDLLSPAVMTVPVKGLQEGMVLAEDVISSNGALLLRKGRRLTSVIVEKLRLHADDDLKQTTIDVVDPKASQAAPRDLPHAAEPADASINAWIPRAQPIG
jgi:response regulator RpfG family c-di-GMP phosphodiesterase